MSDHALGEASGQLGAAPASKFSGDISTRLLGVGAGDDLVHLGSAATDAEVRERLRTQVAIEVGAIVDVVHGHDAFDVIEAVRLREYPIAPVVSVIDGHDGMAVAIEIAALACLARPSRSPGGSPSAALGEVVDEIHRRSARLIRLATFARMALAARAVNDPLARLAAEYQVHHMMVRNLQYDSIRAVVEAELFEHEDLQSHLRRHLGFGYDDFVRVRAAIRETYRRRLEDCREQVTGIVSRAHAEQRQPTEHERDGFVESMNAMMFRPGARASFGVDDVSVVAGIPAAQVELVLQAFSVGFGQADPVELISNLLRGHNLLSTTCLARDHDGRYIMTSRQIGEDAFRVMAELALKRDPKAWKRYESIRKDASERLAIRAIADALQTAPAFRELTYYVPRQGLDASHLDSGCTDRNRVGVQTEADGLFVIDDVAICVEVKGRTISPAARHGSRTALSNEIKQIFRDGARQTRRLESLIRANGGVWGGDGTWLDLSDVREIRSIVVGLDDFGPLAVALGDLIASGLIDDGTTPWIVSLHDVQLIAAVVDRPAEFLLYLRRRTDSGVTTHFRGTDELDLFALYLNGGLFVGDDPDALRQQHPMIPPAREYERRRRHHDARPTTVGTHTDQLDAWMYFREGSSPLPVQKPAFVSVASIATLVDFLADGRKPGWLRIGADILGLEGSAQSRLDREIRATATRTRADGAWHTMVQAYAGAHGYPIIVAATRPPGLSTAEAFNQLDLYLMAKKHQLQADRALGILLNQRKQIIGTVYDNQPPSTASLELDDLVRDMKLKDPRRSRPLPPSARRLARQLRGKRKRRR